MTPPPEPAGFAEWFARSYGTPIGMEVNPVNEAALRSHARHWARAAARHFSTDRALEEVAVEIEATAKRIRLDNQDHTRSCYDALYRSSGLEEAARLVRSRIAQPSEEVIAEGTVTSVTSGVVTEIVVTVKCKAIDGAPLHDVVGQRVRIVREP